jgi:hypothetical protein
MYSNVKNGFCRNFNSVSAIKKEIINLIISYIFRLSGSTLLSILIDIRKTDDEIKWDPKLNFKVMSKINPITIKVRMFFVLKDFNNEV